MMYSKETKLSTTNLKSTFFIILNFVFIDLDLRKYQDQQALISQNCTVVCTWITFNQNLKSQLIDISTFAILVLEDGLKAGHNFAGFNC